MIKSLVLALVHSIFGKAARMESSQLFLESLKSFAFAERRMSGGGGPFTFYCGRNNARGGSAKKSATQLQSRPAGKERNASSAPPIKILSAQVSAAMHLFLSPGLQCCRAREWMLVESSVLSLVPMLTIERILLGVRQRAGINSASIEWNINTPINRKIIELAASAPMQCKKPQEFHAVLRFFFKTSMN